MIGHGFLIRMMIAVGQAAEHGEQAAEQAEHAETGLTMHVPNLLSFIAGPEIAHHYAVTFFALLIALLMVIAATIVYRKRQIIPGPFQNLVEMLVEGLYGMVEGMLGKETDRYIPFLWTLFLYIWFMNLSGIVPLFHAPTSALNMTLALAITVFLYVQFTAITRMGPLKYLHHLAGEPQSPVTWALVVINMPLHVIGEFIKPFSLAMRLFGNIFGEDTLIAVMVSLGVVALAFFGSPVGVPFQLPFYFLAMLLSTIQALVFMMLSTSYIMMALPHEKH
jgi:F-type H+-transporting ATPase subunit a